MPNENTTIQYKQLLDNGEPIYPMVGKSSYSEWIGYEEVGGSGVHPDDQWIGFVDVGGATDVPPYIVPVANGGTGTASGALLVKDFSTNFSVAANSSTAISNSFITVPTGYEMIGVVGLSTNHNQGISFSWRPLGYGSYDFEIKNVASWDISATLAVWVLFAKVGLVDYDLSYL